MNNTQQQFINILSKVVMNKTAIDICRDVNWEDLIELAQIHKVEGIVYSTVANSEIIFKLGVERVKALKTLTFYTAAAQMRNIANLNNIFQMANKSRISVIALKGLVLRDLYPEPELRTMCDADILVHKEDLIELRDLLIPLGYKLEEEDSEKHWQFIHHTLPVIEAHWNGCSDKELSRKMWEKVIPVKIMDTEILTLNHDDFLLYLCMHMAEHMAAMGFGVRQLCDFVLYVEKYRDEIDWNSFKEKSRIIGLERFNQVMFALCKRVFKLNIPFEIKYKEDYDNGYLDLLMEDILTGGVYGRSNKVRMLSNSLSINSKSNSKNPVVSMAKKVGTIMNPMDESLTGPYEYAKKFKILKPIAGIQQIYHSRFDQDNTLAENFKYMYKGIRMSKKKSKLIDWMEL